MARGAVWMVLFKFVERGLGLISTLILARLLTPGDFGIVAMALSFIAIAELLSAFGFDVAIIQNVSATKADYNSAWTCNVLLGLSITLLMVAAAQPIASFYNRPELFWVVTALAFGPLLGGLENIGIVAFRKELDFRREFRFQVTRKFLGFVVVVPLAFALRSYWALVAGILFAKSAGTTISYLMHPFRPRLSLSRFKELFVFSRWLLLNNLVSFFKERSSDFFLGRLAGAVPLGTYNVAYELSNLPTTEISAPINRALLPGFAKLDSPEKMASAYANALGLLALLALPAAACIFSLAPYIVAVLLGKKWLDAIPLMQILAFNGALLLFHSSMCSVLFARGFPARVTASNGVFAFTLIVLLAVFLLLLPELGVQGAAYASLTTSLICTPLYLWQMRRCLGVAPSLFVRAVRRPVLGAAALVLVAHFVLPPHTPEMAGLQTIAWLLIGAVVSLMTYGLVVAASWRTAGRPSASAEQIAWDFLRNQWANRRSKRGESHGN